MPGLARIEPLPMTAELVARGHKSWRFIGYNPQKASGPLAGLGFPTAANHHRDLDEGRVTNEQTIDRTEHAMKQTADRDPLPRLGDSSRGFRRSPPMTLQVRAEWQ